LGEVPGYALDALEVTAPQQIQNNLSAARDARSDLSQDKQRQKISPRLGERPNKTFDGGGGAYHPPDFFGISNRLPLLRASLTLSRYSQSRPS